MSHDDFRGTELSRLFESLPDFVETVLGIIKLESLTSAFLDLSEQCRSLSVGTTQKRFFLPCDEILYAFCRKCISVRIIACIIIRVPRARGLISTTLSLPNKEQRFLTSCEGVPATHRAEEERRHSGDG